MLVSLAIAVSMQGYQFSQAEVSGVAGSKGELEWPLKISKGLDIMANGPFNLALLCCQLHRKP